MEFEEAINQLSRDERFKATVSAMNTLLIRKGGYSQQELEAYFIESAKAQIKKKSKSSSNGKLAQHPEPV